MKKFIILTLGYEDPTPEVMGPWMEWFKKLEPHTVDIGSPFSPGVAISKDGNVGELPHDKDAITGYRIIQAEDMEQVKEIVKGCPSMSGIRIYELMGM